MGDPATSLTRKCASDKWNKVNFENLYIYILEYHNDINTDNDKSKGVSSSNASYDIIRHCFQSYHTLHRHCNSINNHAISRNTMMTPSHHGQKWMLSILHIIMNTFQCNHIKHTIIIPRQKTALNQSPKFVVILIFKLGLRWVLGHKGVPQNKPLPESANKISDTSRQEWVKNILRPWNNRHHFQH